MFNKELMLAEGKGVSDIIVGDAPFMPGDKPDELWPTWFPTEADPFWEFAPGERSNNIELLVYDAGTYLWIGNPRNATTTRTLTFTNLENGLTATFTIKAGDIESNTVAGDALGLYGYPFQKVRMRVYPPYRIPVRKSRWYLPALLRRAW